MRIASVSAEGRGETDRLIAEVAAALEAEGKPLRGIVKVLQDLPDAANHCDMEVRVLGSGQRIRITQSLGAGASGCRLNPSAIAEAVALVEANGEEQDQDRAEAFLLNKFGPEEAEGRGFRAAIARALEQGIPVLVGLTGAANRAGFEAFTAGAAVELPPERDALLSWLRG